MKLFFAGTDTEVGKTYTAALVTRRLTLAGKRVGVYKPVASGCIDNGERLVAEDAVALWEAAGSPRTLEEVGGEFGITRERIRQIEAKTLSKLRHPSRALRLRDYLVEQA